MSFTYSSSITATGSPTSAIPMSTPLISSIANVKDSRWLTLEVCREYQRGKCTRTEQECKFAHPPSHVEVNNGKVIACFDSLKGKCNRTNPPCKYLHPTQHLRDVLIQNGRNNLILRSIAMNLAANPTIYPPAAIQSPYANGAILPQTLPQTATLASYHHLTGSATGAAAPSTFVFNQAGQAFSIPFQSLPQGTTMYAPDGTSYYSPMTHLAQATGPGPKTTRTDRLEIYANPCHDPIKASATVHDDDGGNYSNGYLSAYQTYPGALQTIYTTDMKEPTLITTNADVSLTSNVSSAHELKPAGTQIVTTATHPQYLHPGNNTTSATSQQQKRPAVADPKTGIPVAAYPVPTFSYQSTSSLPIQFQPSYLTAVPMAFTGYSPHLPRL